MTMQTTKAHRNGPHRSRKSRRASAAQAAPAVQAVQTEMFSASDDGETSDRDGQTFQASQAGHRISDRELASAGRHRASFGSFARAKVHGERSTTAPARPTGREVVTGSLGKFGLRRLVHPMDAAAASGESVPMSRRVRPDRGSWAGESAGEELPPLSPFVISADRPLTTAPTAGRFMVPARSVLDVRPGSRPGPVPNVQHAPAPARISPVADVPAPPRAARPTRRLRRARLTSRGHIAVMVLVATAIAGASALANASHDEPVAAAPVAATQEVLVHPGDTVQSIASKFAPAADRADLVALIRAANGLSGSTDVPLPAGGYLIVPAG